MKKNHLICSLRKKCPICGKSYGRKLRGTRETPYLEAISSWKASKTCSKVCRQKLIGIGNAERAAKAQARRIELNDKLRSAMDSFIYGHRLA